MCTTDSIGHKGGAHIVFDYVSGNSFGLTELIVNYGILCADCSKGMFYS